MSDTNKKLRFKVAVIIFLSLCLVFNSAVLAMSTLPIDNNIFRTGIINIELGCIDSNGKEYYLDKNNKLIKENESMFGPGVTIEKKFFIENCGGSRGWDVYYKIYFENIKGKLANEIDIELKDEYGKTVFKGKPVDFVEKKVLTFDRPLRAIGNTKHYYVISFHYPENVESVESGQALEFDFCAKAVQTKNNKYREFN